MLQIFSYTVLFMLLAFMIHNILLLPISSRKLRLQLDVLVFAMGESDLLQDKTILKRIQGISIFRKKWLFFISILIFMINLIAFWFRIISPVGTIGYGIYSILNLTSIVIFEIPTIIMQFCWKGRRNLGLILLCFIVIFYMLPFGVIMKTYPYYYVWNLLLPENRQNQKFTLSKSIQ